LLSTRLSSADFDTRLSAVRAAYIDLLADAKVGLAALEAVASAIPTTPELEADAAKRYAALGLLIGAIPTTPELEADASKRYGVLTQEQLETEWSTDPVVDNVASAALTNLTTHEIPAASFVYPTGATEVRVILLPMIKAAAQAGAVHHIGLKVQRNINDAGWGDLKDYTANPPLCLAADGTSDSWAQPIDITTLVASGNKLQFRFAVDSDQAASVNYTTSFLVVLVYRMGA